MSVDFKQVGQRIAQRRLKLGLRQVDVNEKAGLSDKYLSHIETARSVPSIDVLMRLCSVLNTTPDAFLLGTGVDDPDEAAVILAHKIRQLRNKRQRDLLSNFLDWLVDQDLES